MDYLSYKLVKANIEMIEEINKIYLNCRDALLEQGILQWDEFYPNKAYFHECIENEFLNVLMENNSILGHVVLSEWQSEEWKVINWEKKNPTIIHSLMINPLVQGRGLGPVLVKLCEEYAMDNGYDSVRLDAFSNNAKVLYLYKKLGYQKRGSVFFKSKPIGHQEYICFEKGLQI
ncbi:GNAT family N-acetyltransferase [Halobacillus mangrovi]|uniref:GNAT family N-acetyltransferase n=1 Tax=Halobacillus mangrovi TaxID=402384 RepID=UPI003D9605EF